MGVVRESIEFKRGIDPKKALDLGGWKPADKYEEMGPVEFERFVKKTLPEKTITFFGRSTGNMDWGGINCQS